MHEKYWLYSNESDVSDNLMDEYIDSKFSIDQWSSFLRETVQNSLDARYKNDQPVVIEYNLKDNLSIDDIPGGKKIQEVLTRALNNKLHSLNPQTEKAYQIGLNSIKSDNIRCLKISDYNTIGVETGRDKAWGALLFDEGVSRKSSTEAAGSHGVGKKVNFIMSNVNTVFYYTNNIYYDEMGNQKNDRLFQGKSTFVTWWDEDDIAKSRRGWFGNYNCNADRKNLITPFSGDNINKLKLNNYFTDRDQYGTDVFVICPNLLDYNKTKITMINAVLENFFYGIKDGKIEINVFGELINSVTMNRIVNKYYKTKSVRRNTQISKTLVGGNLYEYLNDLKQNVINMDIVEESKIIGTVKLYFKLGHSQDKKYYSIIRSHGMKIKDVQFSDASQSFSAVAVIVGDKLNKRLRTLENAAHDDFLIDDDFIDSLSQKKQSEVKSAIYSYKSVIRKIEDKIKELTKIEISDTQPVGGMDDLLIELGLNPSLTKSDISIKPKKIRKPNKKKHPKIDNYEEYNNFIIDPFFVKKDQQISLKFSIQSDISNAIIVIKSVNSDDNDINTFLTDMVCKVAINIDSIEMKNNVLEAKILRGGTNYNIAITTIYDITYRLQAYFYVQKEGD